MFFIKSLLFIVLLFLACYYNIYVPFMFSNNIIEIHFSIFVILLFILIYFISSFFAIKNWFLTQKYKKGIKHLENAFSYLLLKDKSKIKDYVFKAKKVFGEIPLINWIEGQFYILNNDPNKAKAIFYKMMTDEKSTLIGNYSLYKMFLENGSDEDAIDSIDAILKISPKSFVVTKAIYILLKNKRFDLTKKYLNAIRKLDNSDYIEAVIYAEEAFYRGKIELSKRAYKLAPSLIKNSLYYADYLISRGELKEARKVLKNTFESAPHQEIFQKFVYSDMSNDNFDRIKLAEKLIEANSNSWIGYYGLAKLLLKEDMLQAAFNNLMIAYEKTNFDFVLNELLNVAHAFSDPKPEVVRLMLSKTNYSKHVEFLWKCKNCSNIEQEWTPICDYCKAIATYEYASEPSQMINHSLIVR